MTILPFAGRFALSYRGAPAGRCAAEAAVSLDALEKAKQLKPHVILLDISMPRMNGIEATAVIHREVPQSEILIVTQYETPEMARLIAEAGAQGYVPRSQVWTALVPAIESVVSPKA